MRTTKIYIFLAWLLFTSGHSDERNSFFVSERSTSDSTESDIEELLNTDKEELHNIAIWYTLLQEMDNLEELIIIERKFVNPGANEKEPPLDIIHLASGLFQEFLIVNSPELRIIGLPGPDGDRLVMIHPGEIVTRMTLSCVGKNTEDTEICLEHFHENSFRICPGANYSDTTDTPPFALVRNELPDGLEQYVCELPLRSYQKDRIRIYRLF